jgi:hypothetical protein
VNIRQVAELCHTVMRTYNIQLGRTTPEWFAAPDWMQAYFIAGVSYVLSGLRKGIHIAPWDIHNVWVRHKLDQGWTYGEKKDQEAKTHPLLVLFDQLPKDEQRKDFLFVGIVEACYRAGIEE